jgi:hypothetical protein
MGIFWEITVTKGALFSPFSLNLPHFDLELFHQLILNNLIQYYCKIILHMVNDFCVSKFITWFMYLMNHLPM